jgi:FADH2 O2-dependent halogenase
MPSSDFAAEADVAILGSGIAGSSLALILARNGVRVLLLDHASHPRFALGESTLRSTSHWMKILAARYGVPELDLVANSHRLAAHIAPTSGIKRGFGFLYHRAGARAAERQWLGNIPTTFSENEPLEGHWFRQDIDAYLYRSALSAGVLGHSRTDIQSVEIADDGVVLASAAGEKFRARYVVDASGYQSVLAKQFGLREQPARFKTESRSLFTHMVGVRPFDDVSNGPAPSIRWHRCTTHHFFDGGWIWVIPFDNHPSSTNSLCSVGLNLDLRHFPKNGKKPEEEWQEILARFPSFAPQFADAKPVRDWVSTGRLQYSSHTSVGDRYCLMSHSYAAVDAIYSRGLSNTMQAVNAVAHRLLGAVRDDDFSAERFAALDVQQRHLLDLHDELAFGTYASLRDPELVDRWLSLFSLIEQLTVAHVEKPFREFLATKDPAALAFDDPAPGHCICHYEPARALLQRCVATMEEHRAGRLKTSEAVADLDAALRDAQVIGFNYDLIRVLLSKGNFSALTARYYRYEELIIRVIAALDRFHFRQPTLASALATPHLARKLAQLLARTEMKPDPLSRCPEADAGLPDVSAWERRVCLDLAPEELGLNAPPGAVGAEIEALGRMLTKLRLRVYRCPPGTRPRSEMLGTPPAAEWELVTAFATESEDFHLFLARDGQALAGLLFILRDGEELALVEARGPLPAPAGPAHS